jgi:hypothetical protein
MTQITKNKKFELNQEQMVKFDNWRKKKGRVDVGTIGGGYTFCFTPTSLGVIVNVKCADNTELSLTDTSKW